MGTEKITSKTQTAGQQELQGNIEYLGGKKGGVKLTHINEDIILLENINPKTKNINFVYNKFREDLSSGDKLLLQNGKDKSKMMLVSKGVYQNGDWSSGMLSYLENKNGKNEMGKDIVNFSLKRIDEVGEAISDVANMSKHILQLPFRLSILAQVSYVNDNNYKTVAKKLAAVFFEAFNAPPAKEELNFLKDIFKSLKDQAVTKEIRRVLINDYKMNPKDICF